MAPSAQKSFGRELGPCLRKILDVASDEDLNAAATEILGLENITGVRDQFRDFISSGAAAEMAAKGMMGNPATMRKLAVRAQDINALPLTLSRKASLRMVSP